MKILITGVNGQVGYELASALFPLGEVVAVSRQQMDMCNLNRIREVVREVKPDWIVNPAAYTAVDLAEDEPELAMTINGHAPAVLAEEAKRIGAALVHYSTDYVFDGKKFESYIEQDETAPLSVYGKTKLAGEQAVADSGVRHLILRTSWVYGSRGKNFFLTIRRLAQEREELNIVADQYGAPTWCRTIAGATARVITDNLACTDKDAWWQQKNGIFHLTAQGQTSWFGFAEAILAQFPRSKVSKLVPIAAHEYPTKADRPANSALSCARFIGEFGALPSWEEALVEFHATL